MALEYLSHLARLDEEDIHPGGKKASAALIRELDPLPGQRILEVGCGTAGTLTRVCLRAPVRAVGLDLLPEMLARAQRRVKEARVADRVTFVRGSAARIPFLDGSFDSVYSESVLGFQKTPALRSALEEIRRVLKPGGRLVINDAIWKPGVSAELATRINEACERDFGLPQATESPWHIDDWLSLFRAHGFVVASSERLSDLTQDGTFADVEAADQVSTPRLRRTLRQTVTWLLPGVIASRFRYRRLLRVYRPVSIHVEGRLFVLRARPSEPLPQP